jgi:hypothetical protein
LRLFEPSEAQKNIWAEEGEFRKVKKRHAKAVKKFQGEGSKRTLRVSGNDSIPKNSQEREYG